MIDQLCLGNCIEVMDTFPEKCIDMAFCSCPFIHWPFTDNSSIDIVSYDAYTRKWLASLKRVLKDDGTIWAIGTYANIFRVGAIIQEEWHILNNVTWVKTNPPPNHHGKNFCNATETLIWAAKDSKNYTFHYQELKAANEDLQMRSDWYFPVCNKNESCLTPDGRKVDFAQKPESLLHQIIISSTNYGDVVLSPFMGAGTTMAVSKKLGRHYIGIDENPESIEVVTHRLSKIKEEEGNITKLPLIGVSKEYIHFVDLITTGYIKAGAKLYLHTIRGKLTDKVATVLSDGTIECNGIRGSMHTVAQRLLGNHAINGWNNWARLVPGGQMMFLDVIRDKYLNDRRQKELE